MSEYLFGGGLGHLSRCVERAVEKEGVTLVNYTDPGCNCGHGCAHGCPRRRRHWFAGPNRGFPFDRQLERRILSVVEKAATKADRKLLAKAKGREP